MPFEPLDWFCQPVANGVWVKAVDSAFGSYTPCAIDSLVVSTCHVVLLGLCFYRIWLIKNDPKVQRFRLISSCYNYMLAMIAGCCSVVPLLRLAMGMAIFSLDDQTGFAPFEVHLLFTSYSRVAFHFLFKFIKLPLPIEHSMVSVASLPVSII